MNDLHIVTLVPLRLDTQNEGPDREAAWDFTYEHLQSFGWPIYTGDSEGPWNRSAAINRAAANADETPWDIAVIADGDTIHLPEELRKGVAWAAKLQTLVIPWRTRWKLSQAGTERFYKEGPDGFSMGDIDMNDRTRVRMPPKVRGGTTIVPRQVWDALSGFDEGFIGWGHEDVAFRIAATTLTPGRMNELRGTIWHLWHPRDIHHEKRGDNDARIGKYLNAEGSRSKMRSLMAELAHV